MLAPGADDALVFPDSAGGWMRASNVRRRWWAKALFDAGLPTDFKLHELRHTAASLAIRSGANIKALQNMLGRLGGLDVGSLRPPLSVRRGRGGSGD
jgi:integrase